MENVRVLLSESHFQIQARFNKQKISKCESANMHFFSLSFIFQCKSQRPCAPTIHINLVIPTFMNIWWKLRGALISATVIYNILIPATNLSYRLKMHPSGVAENSSHNPALVHRWSKATGTSTSIIVKLHISSYRLSELGVKVSGDVLQCVSFC